MVNGGVCDLTYPSSKTRRGRVQANGLITPTITAEGELHKVDKANGRYRIRKLTPKECWRLMGFTDEDFEKAEKVNSNTQLYKQAGNSIVVPVLEEIFKNLLDTEVFNEQRNIDTERDNGRTVEAPLHGFKTAIGRLLHF